MTDFRISTIEERKKFYEKEFDLKKVKRWFKGRKLPQLCAIDAGTDSGILINRKYKGKIFYFRFKDLKKEIKKYVPEDVYYDRNHYKNPDKILETLKFNNFEKQELAFDIDANNIRCKRHNKKIACPICINKAFNWAKRLKRELEKDYKNVILVFSGRGFHVHVLDEKASLLSIKERDALNKRFKDYPIDSWVSRGYIRLIRMPYTLNGLVSRITTPLKNEKFNLKNTIPKFMEY